LALLTVVAEEFFIMICNGYLGEDWPATATQALSKLEFFRSRSLARPPS